MGTLIEVLLHLVFRYGRWPRLARSKNDGGNDASITPDAQDLRFLLKFLQTVTGAGTRGPSYRAVPAGDLPVGLFSVESRLQKYFALRFGRRSFIDSTVSP